jgi:ABC-type multidrug transport system fused ATPase/permease subunit
MEELKKEAIINKENQEKNSLKQDSKLNKEEEMENLLPKNNIEDNKNINDTNINTKNDLEKTQKEKKEEAQKEAEPIIDPKKELEKIKLSHMKNYTIFEILKKSLIFSSKSIKLPLFNIFKKMLSQYLDLKIPIIYGKLLNTIIKEKNYDSLCYEFRKHSLFLFLRVVINEITELFGILFIRNSMNTYKRIVIENIAEKDIEFFDLYRTSEVIQGIGKNENILDNNFIFKTFDLIMDIWNFFYLLFFLNKTSLRLMFLFFFVQFFKFGTDFLLKTYADFRNKNKSRELHNRYNGALFEFIGNIRLIKSMGVEDLQMEKISKLKSAVNKTFCTLDATLGPIVDFSHRMLDTSIVFLAGKYTIFGKMDYSDLTIFQNYSNQLKKGYQKIRNSYKHYVDLYHGWKRFFEFYDFEPKVVSLKNYIPENEENFKYDFEFKNVSFAYPVRPNVLVFNDLSLKIEDGKTTAFVGYSGGGKSTLVTLLQRLYDPLSGEIFLNNRNLKDYNLKWFRQKIGCVTQEPMLLSGSIQDNITYGLKDYDKQYFEEVCKMSNLDFVNDKRSFPHGMKTLVGERGNKLSGGQKQRIAIARALMRDIKILILDEATSALDSKNEKELQDAIEKITKLKKITTIIIAHRLSTVKNADVIMFVNKGQIIEKGKHDELLEKNGEYLKLVRNQLIKTNLDI